MGIFLIIIGAAILIKSSLPAISVVPQASQQQIENLSAKPKDLYIPRISKSLNVTDGRVQGDRWEVSQTGVSYYVDSALPGKGNTVLYGHNKRDILGSLPAVRQNDIIYVVLEDGQVLKYKVFETKEVEPTAVEILNAADESILTIYTCTGFLDQARFVTIAKQEI